jgi:hypothetical protein
MEPYLAARTMVASRTSGKTLRRSFLCNGVSGDQPHFLPTAIFSFPWDRFFDQGERVFEVVLLVLWLAFVIFLACSAVRFLRENAKKKARSRKKGLDRPASPARGLQ